MHSEPAREGERKDDNIRILMEPVYEGTLIRPPSEADSLIFQATLGCSDNRCIFCPAYKDKKFRVRNLEELLKEITGISKTYPDTRKIFFADGDAIIIKQDILVEIFKTAIKCFPKLARISAYGSIKSIETKTQADLEELRKLKLGVIYLGFETGDNTVYDFIRKYGSPRQNIDTCLKIKNAGIKVNTTVILGLGGKKYSKQHAVNTAKILNQAQPDQIAALTLMIAPGTELFSMLKNRSFEELDKFGYLEELSLMIKNMDDFRCLFFSNHSSNYFQVAARFPKDKAGIIESLDAVIKTKNGRKLTPEFLRGL